MSISESRVSRSRTASPEVAVTYGIPYVHLEALDASGHVLTIAPLDRVTFGP
jgi:hypothetical protein